MKTSTLTTLFQKSLFIMIASLRPIVRKNSDEHHTITMAKATSSQKPFTLTRRFLIPYPFANKGEPHAELSFKKKKKRAAKLHQYRLAVDRLVI
jgi:hypothetical protein